jgi:HEAT repeat protein
MTVEVAASQVSAAVPPPPPTAAEQAEIDRAQQEQTEAMLKLIKSKDANERYSAISNLSSLAAKNDPAIDQVLRDATLDNDTNVRSQAIVASAQRSGDDADRQLGLALKDKNVNVRMAVVSAVNSDTAILRQALNDSDSGVRGLAQSKLDQLDKLEMRQSQ